jgi:hydrogenase maturation protease
MRNLLPQNKILILGIGNYLMGDEGVGVHVANRLQKENLTDVTIVDGGTGGFHLLGYFEEYETVILVDATLDNNPNGTIRLIKPRFAEDFPKAMSTHDIGLRDMMCALQLLGKMPKIHLFVVSIESLQQQGIELTGEIEKVIAALIDKIKNLLSVLQREGKNIDDLDGDLPDWQKQLIDQRLQAIAANPGRLRPIGELLEELDNEK